MERLGANIKAIGVGGGGGNMINYLVDKKIGSVELIASNTDIQALDVSKAPLKIQLGLKATKGLGAGMKPEVGKISAEESIESVKSLLDGADMVFISAGLGGGTGTGASPTIAKAAKELNALTVSIVTTPFRFEGRKRKKLAQEGLKELKEVSDSIIHVSNENLLSISKERLGIRESFLLVDNILAEAIIGISSLINAHHTNDINLDFADVKTVMSHRGLALMGVGRGEGSDSAVNAANQALSSPLLDNLKIDGAMGIIVNFHINPDYPLQNISSAMDLIEDQADENAEIIFGTSTNEELGTDEVKLTLVATGFEKEEDSEENPKDKSPEKKLRRFPQGRIISLNEEQKKDKAYMEDLDTPTFMRRRD